MSEDRITALARQVGEVCKLRGRMLVLAESCTGGGLGEAITRIPGSSAWLDRGFITYSNAAKEEQLGVKVETLLTHGAVSEATAREMVLGALRWSRADTAAAVTGIAGPDGGSRDKPVGLVWFAWCVRGGAARVESHQLAGDREAVRRQAVEIALKGLLNALEKTPQ
ncbi:Nicotinamide-nucleotide amidohydrolase PncC [Usitatibacter rugosus]|uniref:Nicotinamide-nucleotide amidohydrolase PncC n=1 Tax=Usitatibacter rugosus TaxID=2732067 RepID=A0A6M4GTR8_9PROT|nr:CinA family protein [Usitatibacter rugosus]QJR10385.1 Nicotinamide-nucleotide amidohydrolase PncC [Usitatibacter rugosus]